MKKIIIMVASGEAYKAEADYDESEGITTARIAKALGHRNFKWYRVSDMLELVLPPTPKTLRGFQEL